MVKVAPVGIVIVSEASPICNAFPVEGLNLSYFISLAMIRPFYINLKFK